MLTPLFLLAAAHAGDPDPASPPAADPSGAPAPPPAAPAAPPPAEAPAPAPAGPTLPVLVFQAPATYPAAALAAGKEAAVLLELEIDAAGAVTAARVVDPVGDGFDEAAVVAARAFRFEPARDADGNPAPAVIQYRSRFTVAKAAAPSVEGSVRDSASDLPFPGLDVKVVAEDGTTVLAVTDADGRFVVSGLKPGAWTLVASPPGHLTTTTGVEVKEGAVAQVALRADPITEEQSSGETLTIQAARATTEITERTLSQEEVRFLPGTGGDVVKVVQNLPGVARAPLGVGQLIIRGTAPEDSLYFLDGASIPIVFHFSGLSTILNGDFVAEVAYLPGNYGARYGRALGGLVDLRTKDDLPTKSGGYVALDLFQGTAYVEQKVGKSTALEFSLRRSWIDAILTPVLQGTGLNIRAPQYWDAQARVFHQKKSGGTVDALFVFSDDAFSVVGEGDEGVAIGLNTRFAKLRTKWVEPLPDGWTSELVLNGGPESQSFAFDGDPEAAYERSLAFGLREELFRDVTDGDGVGMRVGLDLQTGEDSFLYNVTAFSPYEEGASWFFAPALYVEPSLRLGKVVVTPGLRADALTYDFGYGRATADPRLGVKWAVGGTTVLKGAVGRYSQFPTIRQLSPEGDGNPDLKESWSLQSSVGLVQQLPWYMSLEVTAFYNRLFDLVVGREDRFRFFTGPPPIGPFDEEGYANAGSGRVCGTELLLKLDAPNTLGLLSATFSNSVRTGRDGEEELFTNDQPFVINALASQKLPKRWRIGVRGRVGAGDPYTPVVNRVYDMGSRSFIPIYGERDSARLPPTWSVDIRIDKEWKFEKWAFTGYLDLQNAFNVQNPEVMAWTYDFSEEDPISGLPIVPAFGVRGEW